MLTLIKSKFLLWTKKINLIKINLVLVNVFMIILITKANDIDHFVKVFGEIALILTTIVHAISALGIGADGMDDIDVG